MFKKLLGKQINMDTLSLGERVALAKSEPIPAHVAIIMDGNGRWAKKTRDATCCRAP